MDGSTLFAEEKIPTFETTVNPNSKHAVLLLHGLGGGPAEMLYLRRKLKFKGYHVEVPTLPGHCTHYNDLRNLKWEDFAETAYHEFEKLQGKFETVSVSGLCLGAVLSLAIGIRYGEKVNTICPISTTLNYDGWSLPYITKIIPLSHISPLYYIVNNIFKYHVGESEPYGIKDEATRNIIKKKMSATSTTHYNKVPFCSVWEMHKMNTYVKKNLHKITSPICAIHPLEDDVSSIKSVEDIRLGVSSIIFESLILQDSYHLATIDRERDLVADTIGNFLFKRQQIGVI
jgi:carboxylesterase